MASLSQTIISLKEQTGLALAKALKSASKSYSEAGLRDNWLRELRKNPGLYPDGWYDPPPHGVISLFGKPEDNFDRVRQPSFRPKEMWPSADRAYSPSDIMMVYASPVDKTSNLIGDFGLSLYNGTNTEIVQHLERVMQIGLQIAKLAEPGMALRELYSTALELGTNAGFKNDIESASDQTGTNIGHTIPLSFATDPTHAIIREAKSFEDIRDALRTGRKFINAAETQRIEEDIAFTIEPRFSTDTIPNCWFHWTIVFEAGRKTICHGFNPVFAAMEMHDLRKILPT